MSFSLFSMSVRPGVFPADDAPAAISFASIGFVKSFTGRLTKLVAQQRLDPQGGGGVFVLAGLSPDAIMRDQTDRSHATP
jgi:hypothetical protein